MTEIYKTKNRLKPSFKEDIFVQIMSAYNLSDSYSLLVPRANTSAYGIETIRCIGNRLWQTLPSKIKESRNLEVFKRRIEIGQQINKTAGFAKNSL